MLCPTCKKLMIVLELEKVEIDYCTACKGIWLDAGELELLLEGFGERVDFLDSFKELEGSGEKRKKCPICSRKMTKVEPAGREPVTLDKCRLEHGIWFDGGELPKVLEMSDLSGSSKVLAFLKDIFRFPAGLKP